MLRNIFSRPAFAGLGLALLAFLPATATAWSYSIDGASPSSAVIAQTSANDAGQYWAVGTSDFPRVLLRYDGGAVPAAIVSAGPMAMFGAMHTTAQGELVAVTYDQSLLTNCRVVKYATDGTVRWTQLFATCSFGPPADSRIWALADGSFQVRLASRLIRFGGDGRILDSLAVSALAGAVDAVDPRNGTLYTVVAASPGFTPAIVAYDRRGTEQWRRTFDTPVRVAVAGDGSLRVAGVKQGLFVAALGADGAPRWSTIVDAAGSHDGNAVLEAPFVDAAGASWITQGADVAAAKLGADGSVAWRVRRSELGVDAAAAQSDARLASNGDLVLTHGLRASRIDTSGRTRFSKTITVPAFGPPMAVVAALESANRTLLQLYNASPGINGFARLDAEGGELAAPTARDILKTPATAQRATLPDGSIVAWTDGTNGSRELLRIGPDGNLRWRQSTPGTWSVANDGGNYGAVAAAGGRVCTFDTQAHRTVSDHVLECYRADDGSRLWSRDVRENSNFRGARVARLHVATDGSVSVWYAYGVLTDGNASDDVGFARVDRDGNVVASTSFASAQLVNTAPSDAPSALVATRDSVLVVDAAGASRFRFSPTYAVNSTILNAGFGADGSVVVLAPAMASSDTVAVRYDASGRETWRKGFDSTHGFEPPVVHDDAVYVATCCVDGARQRVMRFALADGAVVWQRDLPLTPLARYGSAALALTSDRRAVVAVRSSGRTVDIDVLETRTGSVRASHREACRSSVCNTHTPLVTNDDLLHVLDIGVFGGSSLIGWQVPAANRASIRIDQIGITGAWWAPYANGEGFVLDYLPASRTFFMPWFTFSQDGAYEPSGQRWYVIQGTVPPNATSVQLPITLSVGGAFDAGPTVQAQTVGTATLSFADCSNGTLTYAFNPGVNGSASGTINLTRLGPATESCLLANGTTQPGAGARPPENGFDARMSGSWFEEATSGQGLQFVIQPGGLYFVPWFTFTPRETSAGQPLPSQQRWFTLQGSLANARNGMIEAPIVQTIGGAFDARPTNNMTIVGTSKLTLQGCDRATLEYRFDDNDLAERQRGRSGSIDLVKIGGCRTQ